MNKIWVCDWINADGVDEAYDTKLKAIRNIVNVMAEYYLHDELIERNKDITEIAEGLANAIEQLVDESYIDDEVYLYAIPLYS